jgi:hypothetical protein
VTFQTHGDVTLEHLMKAVMLMAGDRPRVMTLAVPALTDVMMQNIGRYMRQEWVMTLRLLTAEPLADVERMADIVGCDAASLLKRLELAADTRAQDGLLAFSGPNGMVVIQGRILDTVTPGLTLYAGAFGRTDALAIRNITDAWNANFKARRYNISEELRVKSEESINGNSPQTNKRANRKKDKSNEPTEHVAGVSSAEESTEAAEEVVADVVVAGESV